MPKATVLKINNSKEAAIDTGKWVKPGAKFYDTLCDSFDFPSDRVDDPGNLHPADFLKEAYLIAPINKIKNSPYGRTPYSKSGCKYPHHSIKNGELVLNKAGLEAAYARAKQMDEFRGDVKDHLVRHYKELGMYEYSNIAAMESIANNSDEIDAYITENTDTNTERSISHLDLSSLPDKFHFASSNKKEGKEYRDNFSESANKYKDSVIYYMQESECTLNVAYDPFVESRNLKYEFRLVIGEHDGHLYKIVYELNPENIVSDNIDSGEGAERLRKNIRKTGHGNYVSKGNKVIAIIDMSANKRVNKVSAFPPIHNIGGDISPKTISGYMSLMKMFITDPKELKKIEEDLKKECPTGIVPNPGFESAIEASKKEGQNAINYVVGEIDNTATYKTTHLGNVLKGMLHLESASVLDKDFIHKGSIKLDELERLPVTEELIDKYKNQYPCLRHVRCKDTKEYACSGFCWFKDKELVCMVGSCRYRDTGEIYIVSLEVLEPYKGYGLGTQLLDYAVSKMHCTKLSVNKNNKVAIRMYENYGFRRFTTDDTMIYMVYGQPNNASATSFEHSADLSKIAGYPNELSRWMRENISYDKSLYDWRFKSPQETYNLRKGNCHDQAAFAEYIINNMKPNRYKARTLFFIEFNDGSDVGGNTHSLCYYTDTTENKIYWFENAWESNAGIHGPYKSINELKEDIIATYKKDNDVNSHRFEFIAFGDRNSINFGMTLGEYVESWVLEADANGEPKGYKVNDEIPFKENIAYLESVDDQVDASKESLPKQTDRAEKDKNGVERKQLYMEFIEFAKKVNPKNTFGSVFDKNAFKTTYTLIPYELRYFYRLANPLLCVLDNDLTFFALSEISKINKDNPHRDKILIFAGTTENLRVFNSNDKAVYKATEEQLKEGKLIDKIAFSFDGYIEKIIGKKILTKDQNE